MDVDIDLAGRQFEKQQHYRVDRGRNDVAICLSESVLDEAVANQAAVDEDENRIAIQLLDFGFRDEAVETHLAGLGWAGRIAVLIFLLFLASPRRRLGQAYALARLHGCERDQLVEGLFAEDLIDALAVSRYWRGYQHGVGGGMQFKMFFGMGQRVMRYQRGDVGEFGRFGFQEFLARGGIEEEIAHCDGRALRKSGFFDARHLAAVDFEDGSG